MASSNHLTNYDALLRTHPQLDSPDYLRALALRSRSPIVVDLLARVASRGKVQTSSEYLANFKALTKDLRAAGKFARVHALNSGTNQAHEQALEVFDFVWRNSKSSLKLQELNYYTHLLIKFGRSGDARNIWRNRVNLDEPAMGLVVDVSTTYELEPEKWFPKFQRIFGPYGSCLAPIEPSPNAFQNLAPTPNIAQISGHSLVSVVMTTYKPGQEVEHAIDSILNQTYQNLELIIVDDGSGPEYRELLEAILAKDSRVRVIFLERNVGTYEARNVGWLHANGRYLTGQDSDDWAHPRRLEIQVKNLDDNPQLVGNWCRGVRVSEALQLDFYSGKRWVASTAVSMMIRTSPTFLSLGFFDSVRKSADSDYIKRIKAVFGKEAFNDISDVLYVIHARQGSLSRAEFTPGWKHPNRQIYADTYNRWNSKFIREKNSGYFMGLGEDRKFPAPYAFTSAAKREISRQFDRLYVGDFFGQSTNLQWIMKSIDRDLSEGKSVAFSQIASFFVNLNRPSSVKMVTKLHDLYMKGLVDFVALDDPNVTVSQVVSTVDFIALCEPKRAEADVSQIRLGLLSDRVMDLDEVAKRVFQEVFPHGKLIIEDAI